MLCSLSYCPAFFLAIQPSQGGGKGLIASLLSPLSFIYVFLSFCSRLFSGFFSSLHLYGSFIRCLVRLIPPGIAILVFWLLYCAVVLPALVAIFVVVLRFGFLKARSIFLQWILPPTHLTTVLTGALAIQRCWFFFRPPSTRQRDPPSQPLILHFYFYF
jgi:hypothetical protein